MNPDRSPQIQPELLEKIRDTISRIPMPYQSKAEWKVDDLRENKPQRITDPFSDGIERMRFSERLYHVWLKWIFYLIHGESILHTADVPYGNFDFS